MYKLFADTKAMSWRIAQIKLPILVLAMYLSSLYTLQAQNQGFLIESLPVHLSLAGAKKSRAPIFLDGMILFAVKGPYRTVSLALADEGFTNLHQFKKNDFDVFVYALPITPSRTYRPEPFLYRLIIDGVWIPDPFNPAVVYDDNLELEASALALPWVSDLRLGKYKIWDAQNQLARFVFQAPAGEIVSLTGDFNNWNPFLHELQETKPGYYELDLELPPGNHYYNFVYKGNFLPDPLNPLKASTKEGRTVSVLQATPDTPSQ